MSVSTKSIKIILIGDPSTGKTNYCQRLLDPAKTNQAKRNKKDFDIVSIKVKLDDLTEIPVNLINIAGSTNGQTKIPAQHADFDGFIIVFDQTNLRSLDNVMTWKGLVNSVRSIDQIPSMLLANKCDLERDQETVATMGLIAEYCKAFQISSVFETSTITGNNVEESIKTLVQQIVNTCHDPRPDETTASATNTTAEPPAATTTSAPVLTRRSSRVEDQRFTFKIILIGDANTGKTAFLNRYVHRRFDSIYKATIGVDSQEQRIRYRESMILVLRFWDIAGQERTGMMTRAFYKSAAACLIVFDATNPLSLTTGAIKWKKDLDDKLVTDDGQGIPCVLIGNKCDLKKEGAIADETYMQNFVRQHGFTNYFEASAKTGFNVIKSIMFLVDEIMKNKDRINAFPPRQSVLDEDPLEKSAFLKKCCN